MLEMESSFLSELHRDSYGQQQCSGMQSAPSEQMQGCSSLSLPPGLYTPHMPDILAARRRPCSLSTLLRARDQRMAHGTACQTVLARPSAEQAIHQFWWRARRP